MRSINSRRWLMMGVGFGILCELGFLYKDILLWMKTAWFGYTPDSAGMLVPPLFLWMMVVRIKGRPKNDLSPRSGFAVIYGSLVVFILAQLIGINFIQALSLIGVAFGMVVFFAGIRGSAAFLFPFCFLLLMIPSISYLIESVAGAFLRDLVIHGSRLVLDPTGTAWQFHPMGLEYGEKLLQIRLPRTGFSTILLLLIVQFALVEGFQKREIWKFVLMIPFPFFFVGAYICYFFCTGWSLMLDADRMNAVISGASGWLPAVFFFFLMVLVQSGARCAFGMRNPSERGAE